MKLPDYITCLNLVSGLLAIYAAIHGNFWQAAVLIIAGMFFDAIDGWVARRMGVESDFGAEMDSLADLVTFGVAPMVLVTTFYDTTWLSLLAVLLPVTGALRLARHNINRNQTKGFLIGLPITTAGLVIPLVVLLELDSTIAGITVAVLAMLFTSTRRVNKLLS